MKPILFLLLAAGLRVSAGETCCAAPRVEHPPFSGDSLFHLDNPFRDTEGEPARLDSLSGSPTLVAMFYTHCPSVCPRLLVELKDIESDLPERLRGRLRVVLVSFDPERDTPETLAAFAKAWELDRERWSLWTGAETDIRSLAALLGVRYRKLPDGSVSHSAPVVLLNQDGEIAGRLEGAGSDRQAFDARLTALLKEVSP